MPSVGRSGTARGAGHPGGNRGRRCRDSHIPRERASGEGRGEPRGCGGGGSRGVALGNVGRPERSHDRLRSRRPAVPAASEAERSAPEAYPHGRGSTPVNTAEAVGLIGGAIPRRAGTWADFGAGDGTFTRALVELLGQDS